MHQDRSCLANGNDGLGWAFANKVGAYSNVNGGQNGFFEGGYPYSNAAHPGGCNMGFCDGGVRFIKNTLDGVVYSKIITPQGSKLPPFCRQLPVSQDAFAPVSKSRLLQPGMPAQDQKWT